MPSTVVEKETEQKTSQKTSVEASRQDTSTAAHTLDGRQAPVMDGAQPAVLDARTLLSLQSTAGNAAVTSVVEAARKSEPNGHGPHVAAGPARPRPANIGVHRVELKPSAPSAAEAPTRVAHETTVESAEGGAGAGAVAPATLAVEPQAAPAAAAAPGESDGELAALDAQADAPAGGAAANPEIEEGAGPAEAPEEASQEPEAAQGEAALGESEPEEATEPEAATQSAAATEPEAAEAPEGGAEAGDSAGLVSQDAQGELASEQSSFPGEEFRGAGGGGGGSAIEERPAPPVPDLAHGDPTQGLTTVAALPPAQLLAALAGVSASASSVAAEEQARLAAHPPQRPRHPGAPATVAAPASSRNPAPSAGGPKAIPRAAEGRETRLREPEPLPAAPAPATSAVPEPRISGGTDGQLSGSDTQQLAASIASLPERDPALGLSAGAAPQLPLEGNADPNQVHEQRGHLDQGLQQESAEGRQHATAPMGEDEIFPTVPEETLHAEVAPAGKGGLAAAGAAPPGGVDQGASIVAQQLRGAEIRSAASQGIATIATHRQEYAQRTAEERSRADQEMAGLEEANTAEQGAERAAARGQVHGLRSQWTDEQHALVLRAQGEADQTSQGAIQSVLTERTKAQQAAAAHHEQGEREARAAQQQAEQQAASERQKAQSQSSGGLLGWVASTAQSLFDRARQAVQAAFDLARAIVRTAIERARQLATAVLEAARQTIVATIRTAGTALIAIGDRVLSGFSGLRDRFRKAIEERIAQAEALVNRLAQTLKNAVQLALNALGTVLVASMGLLERGLQAAVAGVRAVVQGAIAFAQSAISALGVFAVLVRDVAAGPIRWVSNLAAGAADGIQNHLWPALLTGIRGWFSEKVQSIVGLGTGVWSLLKRGGITLAQVGTFVWEGIKAAIPQTVIWVLIEKLVSLIVPAAAAVMLIIQALQAAWSSIGKIMQAITAFINFLKGVRWGNAGPLFGAAIVASAIAVIEFISNSLLQKLMGAVGKVAGKLRNLAKKIGSRLGQMAGRAAGAGRAIAGRMVGAGGAAAGAVARGAATVGRYIAAGGRAVVRGGRAVATRAVAAGKTVVEGGLALGGRAIRKVRRVAHLTKVTAQLVVKGRNRRAALRAARRGEGEALDMLKWIEEDPHIPPNIQEDFSNRLRSQLLDSSKRDKRVWTLMGDAYQSGNKGTSGAYASLGRRITGSDWAEPGSVTHLSKLIDAETLYRFHVKPGGPIERAFPDAKSFAQAVESGKFDLTTINPATDLEPGSMVSGGMGVGWWNPAHLTHGKTIDDMVGSLAIPPERFSRGALRVTVTVKQATAAGARKPTALHGLVMEEFRPTPPDAAWGRTAGGVPEAVLDPVPLATPNIEAVPAGRAPVPLVGSTPPPPPTPPTPPTVPTAAPVGSSVT